jgi:hypothetical protein
MDIKTIKSSLSYIIFFIIFSYLLTITSKYHTTPIKKTNALRVGRIVPIRELLLITPISYYLWKFISKKMKREKSFSQLFFESILLMFITGFISHYIFSVKSKLGNKLGFLEKPDGTGIAPYSNY